MRILLLVVLALGAGAVLPASGAARSAKTAISIGAQTSNKPVGGLVWATYGKTAQISGETGDGQAGTDVQLEASTFPFTAAPATVGQTQTVDGGSYSFTVKPTVATRYFVELVSDTTSQSRVITVYVSPNWISHTSGRCAGGYTCRLRFSATVVYPAGVAKREGAKRVYYYFGVHYGSQTTPPSRVRLVKTGRQHRRGHRYRESFAVTFSTAQAYYYQWDTCSKDSEAKDGIGLPGHHHCGGKSITHAALQRGYIG
ncbi:MAG TPA: hypothetical protein VGH79_03720 [Gaiellaceae bacterium]|jgi:hypothetical protein